MRDLISASMTMPESQASSTYLRDNFVLPLVTVACLIVLALTAGVHFAVKGLDGESAGREQTLAQNGLLLRMEEVSAMVVPQTDWDDAVRNLDNAYNPDWAALNINEFLDHTHGFRGTYVIDAEGKPVFSAEAGTVVTSDQFGNVAPIAGKLVDKVRKLEAARGPLRKISTSDVISMPLQASSLKVLGKDLVIVTATLVQPDFGTALPRGPRAPIVVTTMPVDQRFLTSFSRRFLLEDVSVRLPDQAVRPGTIAIPVKDDTGRSVAYLAWRPHNPGYAMLHRVAAPALLTLLVICGIAAFQLRRIFEATRRLIERESFARDLAYHDASTGLPNRNSLEEHLDWEMAEMTPLESAVAVTCIRLPELHWIADRMGVHARDEYVAIVASRLTKACRPDSMLARIATDEFAVMTVTSQPREAGIFADRLRGVLATPASLADGQVDLACQIGTSLTQMRVPASHLIHDAYMAALHAGRRM